MQLMCKFNKGIHFLFVMDIFSKYTLAIPLKDKEVLKLLMLFKKIYMNIIVNQTKLGKIKAGGFIIDQWNYC